MSDTLINQDRICNLLGCKRPSDAARLLEQQGILPIKGRPGLNYRPETLPTDY